MDPKDSSPENHSTPPKASSKAADYYFNNPNKRSLLGHISIGVTSLTTSQLFYTSILNPFGLILAFHSPPKGILGYAFPATPLQEIISIFECGDLARPPGAGTHIAFNAPSRASVVEFWENGMRNGGTCVGTPGIRDNYGDNYFAAFLLDPDGFKLEAVFQDEME